MTNHSLGAGVGHKKKQQTGFDSVRKSWNRENADDGQDSQHSTQN
ncbi:MAG: hypothetical protein VYE30_04620 [Pseudomonadota bacterium]|nr:hypothetical protein [Pseudomonadota bacterium]